MNYFPQSYMRRLDFFFFLYIYKKEYSHRHWRNIEEDFTVVPGWGDLDLEECEHNYNNYFPHPPCLTWILFIDRNIIKTK